MSDCNASNPPPLNLTDECPPLFSGKQPTMSDASVNFWVATKYTNSTETSTSPQVNPFQMLRFSGNERPSELTSKEAGVVDGENGDNTITRTHSPRPTTPGSYTKKSSPPLSTRTRRHSFISPDEKPPKGTNYMPLTPTKVVTTADAAAVLAASLAPLNYDKKMHHQTHSHKYTSDEKPKKQLKRSVSFNHSNQSVSPRVAPYIDVAEVLATTVSFVRENNKKLDRLSDEVRSEGLSSDNDADSYLSDDSIDSWPQQSGVNNREIENEITMLSVQLDSMEQKYKEQLRGKNKLIEELERALRKREKDDKKKSLEIERLEGQLEASRRAITELVEQQQLEAFNSTSRTDSSDPEQSESLKLFEQELEEKNRIIDDLTKKIQNSARRINESKEKEKKFEAISNQLLKYQTLESEWQDKQKTLDSLSSQLEILKRREAELHEKDSLIESLNIRLDTSQKVIAELREKHAPQDLLRQLREKDYMIDHLTQQFENIDADIKDRDDEIELLASKLTTESKKVEKLKEQTSQIDPLKKRLEEADDLVYDVRQQLSQKERMLADLERKYKESLRNSSESVEKLKSQEQSVVSLRQEISQLRQAINVQASEARERDRVMASLKDENAHMRSNYQNLINALTEKDQKIAQLEQNIESSQGPAKADPQESKVNKLTALKKVLDTKIETCREYEKKIGDLEKEFDIIKKQLEESKTSSSEKEIKIARLVKMNRQLKEEVTELKEKMEAKEQELITIKSRIPKPAQTKSPASSVRSASKTPKSRVSSMYSISGGESSGDETANGSRVRRPASLSGIESPLRNKVSLASSRRLSDSPRVALTRTKSSASTSSIQSSRSKTISLPKSRVSSTPGTVEDVLKKKRDSTITPKKEPSPINRSAVSQRKRDMSVLNHMLSGVAPDRKNRLSTLAAQKATSEKGVAKKKPTDTISSDSDREVKSGPTSRRSSDLATIMEKSRPKVTRASADKKTLVPPARTSLTRPLPSKRSSPTA
ncbi:14978_t:CDS:2 [Acaulospora colombiana]|uniref:14978_t:CDS:1 n=1 Tax=Acaulospora colombiana TaxID=27376 RepID=A0ACA9M6M7_9GLOM|nr:14978_t:CDS:2 [Acaulospora colombiana]